MARRKGCCSGYLALRLCPRAAKKSDSRAADAFLIPIPRLRQASQLFRQERVEPVGIDCVQEPSVDRSPSDAPPVDDGHSNRQRAVGLNHDIDLTPVIKIRAQKVSDHGGIVQRLGALAEFGAAVSFEHSQQLGNRLAAAVRERLERRKTRLSGDQLMRDVERYHRDRDAAIDYDRRGMRVDMNIEFGRRGHITELEAGTAHDNQFADLANY